MDSRFRGNDGAFLFRVVSLLFCDSGSFPVSSVILGGFPFSSVIPGERSETRNPWSQVARCGLLSEGNEMDSRFRGNDGEEPGMTGRRGVLNNTFGLFIPAVFLATI